MPRHPRLFISGDPYHVYCRVARGGFVFDPETISDVVTYEEPNRAAVGIESVLIVGMPFVAESDCLRGKSPPEAGVSFPKLVEPIGIDPAEGCVRPSEVFRGERSSRVAFEILFERDRFGSAVEGHCSLDPPWPEFRCVRDLA